MKRHGCRSQPVAAAAVTRLLGVGSGVDRSSWEESSADESQLLPEVVTLEVDRSIT